MLIDTHCHLDAVEFAGDRDALLLAARAAGPLVSINRTIAEGLRS